MPAQVEDFIRFEQEFFCNECDRYMKTYLRTNMFGNFTIECANDKCKHHHFRVIEKGEVTQQRHSEKYGTTTILECLPSTLRETPYHTDPKFLRSLIRIFPNDQALQNAHLALTGRMA